MFLNLLDVFAEFERELIRKRCMAGQLAARERDPVWGRPASLPFGESVMLAKMWRGQWADQRQLAEMFGVSIGCIRDSIHKTGGRSRWTTTK